MLNNLDKVQDKLKYIKKIPDYKMKNLIHNYQ